MVPKGRKLGEAGKCCIMSFAVCKVLFIEYYEEVEVRWAYMDWVHLAQDSAWTPAYINTIMSLWIP